VKMLRLLSVISMVVASGAGWPARAGEGAADPSKEAQTGMAEAEKTFAKLAQLVGGTWVGEDKRFPVESRYEWAFNETVIRGRGLIGRGSPYEQQIEALMGLDAVKKAVYYVDFHGGKSVLQGTVKLEGDDLVFEFATVVGQLAKWREVARFPDTDTLQFTIFADKGGKWTPLMTQTSKRRHSEARPDQVVSEGVIEAPVEAVWAALTTKEGQESWNVAHAEVDLKVGGKMRTHYDPKGILGDPNTIEHVILAFEPNRMFAQQVVHSPEKFPFKDAIRKMWTVIHFEDAGPGRTRLRVVGVGYGDDEESRKLKAFFAKGNDYTIKKLQAKFDAKAKRPTGPAH
jgi:uncharacterized protein YndB with AHSA1/START domain